VLQGMIDRLTETGRFYGIKINVGKKGKLIKSKGEHDQKQLYDAEYFSYLADIIIN
jgi:hypothetical protein